MQTGFKQSLLWGRNNAHRHYSNLLYFLLPAIFSVLFLIFLKIYLSVWERECASTCEGQGEAVLKQNLNWEWSLHFRAQTPLPWSWPEPKPRFGWHWLRTQVPLVCFIFKNYPFFLLILSTPTLLNVSWMSEFSH